MFTSIMDRIKSKKNTNEEDKTKSKKKEVRFAGDDASETMNDDNVAAMNKDDVEENTNTAKTDKASDKNKNKEDDVAENPKTKKINEAANKPEKRKLKTILKSRKSPRILRIKARSYSNEKSNPIQFAEEDSEYSEGTDSELTLSVDRANTLTEMDNEIEKQLDESRSKKVQKRNERNIMVREKRMKKLQESYTREGKKKGKLRMLKQKGKQKQRSKRQMKAHLRKIDTFYKWLVRDMKNFEKSIENGKRMYPESEEIKSLEKKYKEELKEMLNESRDVPNKAEPKTPKTKSGMQGRKDETESNSGHVLSSQPSFELGSQIPWPMDEISSYQGEMNEGNTKSDAIMLNVENILDRPNRIKHPTYASKSPFVIREVEICKPITKEETKIWNYLMDNSKEKLFRDDKTENKKDEAENDSNKEENNSTTEKKKACIICQEEREVEANFDDNIFETVSGLASKRFLLRSLEPGETLLNNVIDCWAAVLNGNEEIKSEESDRRLFCDTSVITVDMLQNEKFNEATRLEIMESSLKTLLKGTEDEPGLKTFDLVLIPILENAHYYLICFDLQKSVIEVVDNIHHSKSFVDLNDDEEYSNKYTVLKVKHMFVLYLKSMGHEKWEAMEAAKPVKLDLTWATKHNSIDCGVFLMRHMECYKKSRTKNWDCGFKTEKSKRQKAQLNLLRMKYAAKILTSKVNIHRDDVIKNASEFEQSKNEEKE